MAPYWNNLFPMPSLCFTRRTQNTIINSLLSMIKFRTFSSRKRLISWTVFSHLRLESPIWKCMTPSGPCFILLLEIQSNYNRAKKGTLGTVEPVKATDLAKLELNGKEYEGIQMSPPELFEYWEPVVFLSKHEIFVLSSSGSNLIAASLRWFMPSLGPQPLEC